MNRVPPDFEETLRFYESIKPHMEMALDEDQKMELICLLISDHCRYKQLTLEDLIRKTLCFETAVLCASFVPTSEGSHDRIEIVAQRIMDISKKFLLKKEAELALLECFLRCTDKESHLSKMVENYLEEQ